MLPMARASTRTDTDVDVWTENWIMAMIFTRLQQARLAAILSDAARTEIMPRFRNLGSTSVREKTSALDLVTDADEAAESLIMHGLNRAFPDALVIGEEAATADPAMLARMRDADLTIVIDPIDGTLNYASGLPLFAVMAAVIIRGEIAAAVIHDPVLNESHMALRGEGAWCETADGQHTDLKVAPPLAVADMAGTIAWRYLDEPLRSRITSRYPRLGDVSCLRCCAHEYRLLAAGKTHFMVVGRMMPWDHAPGTLLHREAGGYAALFDGLPYDPATLPSGQIYAPDKDSWNALRETLLSA